MRVVICHYHIYKNSGTSFDLLLKENFGEKHIAFDGPFPFFTIDQEQLSRIIERKNNIVAFSSHQIHLPAPVSLNFLVLPVVFIRHPLLRVQSIYNFKRQTYDGTTTSEAAMKLSFNDWVEYCFSDNQEITHISNAQTRMLGSAYKQKSLMRRSPGKMEYDIDQAIRNIRNVPLLARTEYFNDDVKKFPAILEKYNLDFKFSPINPQNVTNKNHHKTLDERLNELAQLLPEPSYKKIVAANNQDLMLFEYSSEIINTDFQLLRSHHS